jgi:DegV family protein with EDD domain
VADRQPVVIVTDSTADIPKDMASETGIVVVPLSITFGDESFRDGIDLSPTEFIARLEASPTLPTTSQPPVSAFEEVFRAATENGQDVVCVTLSSGLSGTFNAARLAAETVGADRIWIIDSRSASMAVGWVAIAAARAAKTGASLAEVTQAATDAVARVRLYAVLQTLDYVHKGGRIGKAQQLVGSALGIKPILTIADGILQPLERVRLWKRAVSRMTELITPGPTDIMVLHSDNLPDAERVANDLRQAHPDASVGIGFVGATIITYAGPGAIGIAALYGSPGQA